MAEDADEVKVFRRRGGEPVDDDPVPHSSLAEDKKDAALETELEIPHGHHHIKALPLLLGATTTTTTSTSIKPNLVPLNGSGLSPGYGAGFMPFFPFLMGPYGMPSPFGRLAPPAHDASRTSPFVLSLEQRLSPHYAAAAAAAAAPYYFGAGALSPTFDFYRNLSSSMSNPGSPLQSASINNNKNNVASVPLAASMMQKMAAAAAASSSTSSTAASSLINPRQRQSHHHVPSTNASTSQPSSPATTTSNGLKRAPKPERSNKLDKDDRHIKKPLNAFMWFMKENRPKLMEEQNYKERQSAELNKELGRRWHILPHEEQQKYYQMAKDDREKHMVTYPGWSARENYALNKKKKRKRDKSLENAEQKKCRARFGVGNQAQWCKHCRRKKRCLLARPGARSPPGNLVSSTTTNSMLNNGNGPGNEDDEEDDDETASESSSSDIDAGEDPIAAAEALAATSDMAPGQSFTMTSEASVPVV